ncbi:MAG TPA: hypothetical protein VFK38_03120 [Candidatus Limnocylindrales bacterium]|nr:hypothetical protein [Candidatus Limnocylindrales bacterium]
MSTGGSVTPAPARRGRRPALLAWTAALAVGFGLVFGLGRPVERTEDALAAAYSPKPPVTRDAALASAETIVRTEYPTFVTGTRTVELRQDFGLERWVVVYTLPDQAAGVRLSFGVGDGKVSVSTFP